MLGAAGAHRKTKCAAAFYNGVICWDELAHRVRGEARAALRHDAGAYRFPIIRIRHPDDLAKAACNAVSWIWASSFPLTAAMRPEIP